MVAADRAARMVRNCNFFMVEFGNDGSGRRWGNGGIGFIDGAVKDDWAAVLSAHAPDCSR